MLWEVAERQRRKSAREGPSTTTSSLVVDVARRASALWSRRSSHLSADGGGKHRVLQTSEDHVRLDDIMASPSPSAPPSPSLSLGPSPNHHPGPYARPAGNPFSDPIPGSTSSLFVNAQSTVEIDATLPSSATAVEPATPTSAGAPLLPSPSTVSQSGNRLSTKVVSAPAPLDLPKPRTPPPRTATPHAKRPPEPFPHTEEEEEDVKPVRWWTEWLCGCSEGPDRGGELQVRSIIVSLASRLAYYHTL